MAIVVVNNNKWIPYQGEGSNTTSDDIIKKLVEDKNVAAADAAEKVLAAANSSSVDVEGLGEHVNRFYQKSDTRKLQTMINFQLTKSLFFHSFCIVTDFDRIFFVNFWCQ